jgi:hypothetical protein
LGARIGADTRKWLDTVKRTKVGVARLLLPESSSVEHVSREVGTNMATVERWGGGCLGQWIWRPQPGALNGSGAAECAALARYQTVLLGPTGER